jgi:uncharacterized protein with HEPN domain
MTGRDESVYVRHMLDAIARLQRHVAGVDRKRFESTEMIQDAVFRQLEILGEAAGRISRETCARFPGIPWTKITGLRHRLIHDYLGVDVPLVWGAVTAEIPRITPLLESLLEELAPNE